MWFTHQIELYWFGLCVCGAQIIASPIRHQKFSLNFPFSMSLVVAMSLEWCPAEPATPSNRSTRQIQIKHVEWAHKFPYIIIFWQHNFPLIPGLRKVKFIDHFYSSSNRRGVAENYCGIDETWPLFTCIYMSPIHIMNTNINNNIMCERFLLPLSTTTTILCLSLDNFLFLSLTFPYRWLAAEL